MNSESVLVTPVQALAISETPHRSIKRSYTGIVKAARNSDLGFKRTGRIERVFVQNGDQVRKGQVLAELDTASIEANYANAQAQAMAADARLRELKAGPRRQSVAAAKATLAELESLAEQQRITFRRRNSLANTDAISAQSLDDAKYSVLAMENKILAQKNLVDELVEGTRQEQIDAQAAVVAQLAALLTSIEIELSESKLVAPYDGTIAQRAADEGAIVNPGSVILRIVESDAMEAWIGIPLEMVSQLQVGAIQQIDSQGVTYQGTIKAILPELSSETRTSTVIYTLAPLPLLGQKHTMKQSIGQLAHVELPLPIKHEGFWIPTRALTRGIRGLWSLYVLADPDDDLTYRVQRCDVEVLQVDSDQVLVQGTLKVGDRIVDGGVQRLATGQRVRMIDVSDGNKVDALQSSGPTENDRR
jgi:RND family efflux transporter MFP subunit